MPDTAEQGEMVKVPLGQGRTMDAYLVSPATSRPSPGVVVIHEIYGLSENIRDIARRFAGEGYVALAVDLFSSGSRVACMLRIFYGILLHPLENGTVSDLRSALDFLQIQPGVDPSQVGAIGFCMGGSYALQLACVDESLRASSVFYGQNPRPLDAVARACPIVGSYPEQDFTANAARQLEPMLERHGVPHDIKIYPGARHSFFDETRPAHNPAAAADAWARTLSFFEAHLRSPSVKK
jgi:carboxymethylenebutenolidase